MHSSAGGQYVQKWWGCCAVSQSLGRRGVWCTQQCMFRKLIALFMYDSMILTGQEDLKMQSPLCTHLCCECIPFLAQTTSLHL